MSKFLTIHSQLSIRASHANPESAPPQELPEVKAPDPLKIVQVNEQKQNCPHCKKDIEEGEYHHDGMNWFHIPCAAKGGVAPPSFSPENIEGLQSYFGEDGFEKFLK